MANAVAIVTLKKGPLTYKIGELNFSRGTPVHVAITRLNESTIERLKGDPNFEVQMPSKKADPKVKAKRNAAPEPTETEDEESEDDESEDEDGDAGDDEEEGDGEEEEEAEAEETEASAEGLTRKQMKGMTKAALAKLAKKLRVKIDPKSSRSAIADAILEAQTE